MEGNENDQTGESGPFSPALPCPPSFSLVAETRHATRVPRSSFTPSRRGRSPPHRVLHAVVVPPPTHALFLPCPLLLSSLLAPFFTFGCTRNRLCHLRSLHVGRTCVAKKDTTSSSATWLQGCTGFARWLWSLGSTTRAGVTPIYRPRLVPPSAAAAPRSK